MSNEIDIERFTSDELTKEKLKNLIENKKSFKVVAVNNISLVVAKVEGEIERQNLRCRVYTEYRSAAIGGIAVPAGITQITAAATAIGIGVHNIITINPDYEIAKNKFKDSVTVLYKKG